MRLETPAQVHTIVGALAFVTSASMGGFMSREPVTFTFKKMDLDWDSQLTIDELTKFCQKLDAGTWTDVACKALFNAVDTSRNGVITVDELAQWISGDEKPEQFESVSTAFLEKSTLECYPKKFAFILRKFAYAAGLRALCESKVDNGKASGSELDFWKMRLQQLDPETWPAKLLKEGVLSQGACGQFKVLAVIAGKFALSTYFQGEITSGNPNFPAAETQKSCFDEAAQPKPYEVTEGLWQATQAICYAAASMAILHELKHSSKPVTIERNTLGEGTDSYNQQDKLLNAADEMIGGGLNEHAVVERFLDWELEFLNPRNQTPFV